MIAPEGGREPASVDAIDRICPFVGSTAHDRRTDGETGFAEEAMPGGRTDKDDKAVGCEGRNQPKSADGLRRHVPHLL